MGVPPRRSPGRERSPAPPTGTHCRSGQATRGAGNCALSRSPAGGPERPDAPFGRWRPAPTAGRYCREGSAAAACLAALVDAAEREIGRMGAPPSCPGAGGRSCCVQGCGAGPGRASPRPVVKLSAAEVSGSSGSRAARLPRTGSGTISTYVWRLPAGAVRRLWPQIRAAWATSVGPVAAMATDRGASSRSQSGVAGAGGWARAEEGDLHRQLDPGVGAGLQELGTGVAEVGPREGGGVHPDAAEGGERLLVAVHRPQDQGQVVAEAGGLPVPGRVAVRQRLCAGHRRLGAEGVRVGVGRLVVGDQVLHDGLERQRVEPGAGRRLVGRSLGEGEHLLVRAVPLAAEVLERLDVAALVVRVAGVRLGQVGVEDLARGLDAPGLGQRDAPRDRVVGVELGGGGDHRHRVPQHRVERPELVGLDVPGAGAGPYLPGLVDVLVGLDQYGVGVLRGLLQPAVQPARVVQRGPGEPGDAGVPALPLGVLAGGGEQLGGRGVVARGGGGEGRPQRGVRGVEDHGVVRGQVGAYRVAVAQDARDGEEGGQTHGGGSSVEGRDGTGAWGDGRRARRQVAGAPAAAEAWTSPRWRIWRKVKSARSSPTAYTALSAVVTFLPLVKPPTVK